MAQPFEAPGAGSPGAGDDAAEPRDAAQELHETACGWAELHHGVDLCAGGDPPADAPADLVAHYAYHQLAWELGAVCAVPRNRPATAAPSAPLLGP